MKIEEVLHLFTKCSEELPELGVHVTIITIGGFMTVGAKQNWGWEIFNPHGLLEPEDNADNQVGYWLDLSKLTTKERAERFALEAWIDGSFRGSVTGGEEFITNNKHNL